MLGVCALDARRAWVVGRDYNNFKNFLIQTVGGGDIWTPILEQGFTAPGAYVNLVHFWNRDEGIVMGDPTATTGSSVKYFEIWRTTNGGST